MDEATYEWMGIYTGLIPIPLKSVGVLLTWDRIRFSDGPLGVGQAEHTEMELFW